MRVLELFKGTGSISKWIKENNYNIEVYSVDILKKFKPTYCGDIMEWDYKQFDKNYFDIVWASPECKIFSPLQYTHIGRKWETREDLFKEQKKHTKFILRTLEIIEYFNPRYWFIENPLNSRIWKYLPKQYNSVNVDYCMFGFNYKKPTKILTNVNLPHLRCELKGKHKFKIGMQAESGRKDESGGVLGRYRIPPKLISYLLQHISVSTNNIYNTKCCGS
tara:strand:- start:1344 stop:2003 length:660 start_codon:yes stop_codon:yes gene_type:complete